MIETKDNTVSTILTLIKKGENTRDIAEKLNFDSHRSMALFMRSKGYVWDENKNTYLLDGLKEKEQKDNNLKQKQQEKKPEEKSDNHQFANNFNMDVQNYAVKYAELLEYLDQRKDQLGELFTEPESLSRLPRYAVPGIHITKSVHMVYELDQLVRDFSKEKNITQREIFEIALINFFKRYGYKERIEALLE